MQWKVKWFWHLNNEFSQQSVWLGFQFLDRKESLCFASSFETSGLCRLNAVSCSSRKFDYLFILDSYIVCVLYTFDSSRLPKTQRIKHHICLSWSSSHRRKRRMSSLSVGGLLTKLCIYNKNALPVNTERQMHFDLLTMSFTRINRQNVC